MKQSRSVLPVIILAIFAISLGSLVMSTIKFDPYSGTESKPLYVDTDDLILFVKPFHDSETIEHIGAYIIVAGYNYSDYRPMLRGGTYDQPPDPMAGKEVYRDTFRLNVKESETMFQSATGISYRQGIYYGYWDIPDRDVQTVYRIWWYDEELMFNVYSATPTTKTFHTSSFPIWSYSVIKTKLEVVEPSPEIRVLRSTELEAPPPTDITSSTDATGSATPPTDSTSPLPTLPSDSLSETPPSGYATPPLDEIAEETLSDFAETAIGETATPPLDEIAEETLSDFAETAIGETAPSGESSERSGGSTSSSTTVTTTTSTTSITNIVSDYSPVLILFGVVLVMVILIRGRRRLL